MTEPILEAELRIIDAHHHFWDRRSAPALRPEDHPFLVAIEGARRYLLDELLHDIRSGHNVVATVYAECGHFYRQDGPEDFRPIGETEVVNGMAALSASGIYGPVRACAGIVGYANLQLGDRVVPVLEAHIAAGGGRFCGIRNRAAHDADPEVLGPLKPAAPGLYASRSFRAGLRCLAPLGLSFDAWVLEHQLPELVDLVRAHPETPIIVDHLASPLGVGRYAHEKADRFAKWQANIRELSRSPSVALKLSGLGMSFCGFPSFLQEPRASSRQLAEEWRPYMETAIEAFGSRRCMFASNFPPDKGSADYRTLWNAFKQIASHLSDDEKRDLFSGTAERIYKLDRPK
jgi:L-fuconolactonase